MTANLYSSRALVVKRMPLGSVQSPAGLTASSLSSTDSFTFDGHGLETGDAVVVRAVENGTLPEPLIAGTTYYAIRQTNSAFQLSATPTGSAVNLTADGDQVVVAKEPDFDTWIEFYSRWADTFMPAHAVPFTNPVPVLVQGLVSDLVAKRILNTDGKSSKAVDDAEIAAMAQLQRFATGIPLRDANETPRTSKAITSFLVNPAASDPRGWGSRCIP